MANNTSTSDEPVRVLIADDKMLRESAMNVDGLQKALSNHLAPIRVDAGRSSESEVVVTYLNDAEELRERLAEESWDFIAVDNHWEQEGEQLGFDLAAQLRTQDGPNRYTPLCIFTQHDWLSRPENVNRVFGLDEPLGHVETFADCFQKTPSIYYKNGNDWIAHFSMQLLIRMKACFRVRSFADEISAFIRYTQPSTSIDAIIGETKVVRELKDIIGRFAKSTATVLITGETGTGKELVAAALHKNSERSDKPFVKVNCAALPPTLVESELFGHIKGAFTGSTKDRRGRFEMADGGTLFLDEIGELALETQAKLLRVLREGEFERIGQSDPTNVDVRIIAATNRPLRQMVDEGQFREDLYFRLNVAPIEVPPLRKRPEDIPLLARHILGKFMDVHKDGVVNFTDETLEALSKYRWPGNVGELENVIQRALLLRQGSLIEPSVLPPEISGKRHVANEGTSLPWRNEGESVMDYLDRFKQDIMHEMVPKLLLKYADSGEPSRKAAEEMGVPPSTFSGLVKDVLGMRATDWLRQQRQQG